jgi:hypothetical protein
VHTLSHSTIWAFIGWSYRLLQYVQFYDQLSQNRLETGVGCFKGTFTLTICADNQINRTML